MKWITAAAACLLAGCAGVETLDLTRHPAYREALSDLNAAQWDITHDPDHYRAGAYDDAAKREIAAAIWDIQHAGTAPGASVGGSADTGDSPGDRGYLRRALEFLNRTKRGLAREDADPAIQSLRNRSLAHMNKAIALLRRAISTIEKGPRSSGGRAR